METKETSGKKQNQRTLFLKFKKNPLLYKFKKNKSHFLYVINLHSFFLLL